MKYFIIKSLLILFLPFSLIIYCILIAVNQNIENFDQIIKKNIFIIGEPFNEKYTEYYKFNKNINKTDFLAIGSSRVLQFKSDFFSTSFFNLGYLAFTPSQENELINKLNIKNKTLLVSLDQWVFNSNWPEIRAKFKVPQRPHFLETVFNNNRLESVITFKNYPIFHHYNKSLHLFGAGANLALSGMVNDGSYYYGKIYHGILTDDKLLVGNDYKFKNTLDRIQNGVGKFEWGDRADQQSLIDFEELVINNIKRKNKVKYFFPPFAPSIQIQLKNPNYLYINDASNKVKAICIKYNVEFYDFTFMPSKDINFIDGFHGGSKVYYQILKQMNLNIGTPRFTNNFETISDSVYSKERSIFFKK